MKYILISVLFLFQGFLFGQNLQDKIKSVDQEIQILDHKKDSLLEVLENFKLEAIHKSLKEKGLPELKPGEKLIEHKAMILVYDENHEQAKWVAHIISPDIANGNVGRTNNFRMDTCIVTGSANDSDYFIRTITTHGKYKYKGFGYDRGHLAPSADFRWSKQALSESYLYSNMSPQKADFNRKGWAELEDLLRKYVIDKQCSLYVVTGGVLNDSLEKVEGSAHHISVPNYYYKVAYDEKNQKGIGFLMPNNKIKYPVQSYAESIDDIEKITGINFFCHINNENSIESQNNVSDWLTGKQKHDTAPMTNNLPKGTYNTVQAKNFMDSDKKVTICGTVVSTKHSNAGNIFINLDQAFPNQIFSIAIWKRETVNFSYDPSIELKYKKICVTGKITNNKGVPSMSISNEKQIQIIDE